MFPSLVIRRLRRPPGPWALWALWAALAGCAATAPPGAQDTETVAPAPDTDESFVMPENVATAVLMGSALMESGEVGEALPYFRFAWEASDGDPSIGESYVEAALRAGKPRVALEVLDRLQRDDPAEAEYAIDRGRLLLMLGEMDEADRATEELMLDHPDLDVALELRLDTLRATGRNDEALVVLDELRRRSPDDPNLALAAGDLHRSAGRDEEAERSWKQASEIDPTHLGAVDRLSDLWREQGRTDELIAFLETMLPRLNEAPIQQARLADLYLAIGESDKAIDLLLPLAQTGQLEVQAYLVVADLLAQSDRREEAMDLLRVQIDDGPVPGVVHRMLGELALEGEDLDTADSELRTAIRLDPEDGNAVVSLLLTLSRRDGGAILDPEGSDPEKAAEFERLLQRAEEVVDPRSVRQNFLLGAMLRRSDREERAIHFLDRARELDPENRQVLYDLAVTQESLRDFEAAATTLETLVGIDPDDAHLLNFYGYLLADQGWQLERAEEMIVRAVEQEPDNGFYADSLGWVYYRLGRLEEALEEIIRASNLVGDDPVLLEHMGDVLRDLDRPADALRVYLRALEIGGDPERLEPRIEEVEAAGDR